MRRILYVVGIACLLVGCGGGGDDGNFDNPNPFTGSWVGTIRAEGSDSEELRLTIADNGSITGSESVGPDTAAITGNVDRNGNFNLTSRLAGTQDVTYRGDMRLETNSRITGVGTGTQGGTTVDITFTINRQGF
jgi:hypothetical protein